jgi:hypothetical protein
MFNFFRGRLSAAAFVFVITIAACCSPSGARGGCPGSSEEAKPQAPASMDADRDMDGGVGMLSPETKACPLSVLAKNDPEPPLYPYIGSAHWHVPSGQEYFDQGLRFYFAFNNRESYRAFRKAASEARDDGIPCSACYWAQALVLGVDLNMKKESEDDRLAANKALDEALGAYPNEEDLEIIQALRGRYQDCNPNKKDKKQEKICQGIRNQAYYEGMETVLHEFGSDDPNVVTLFADAAMNLTPWDFWDKNGDPKYPKFSEQITAAKKELERALNFVQYPRNEGPLHWYIHLMEQSPTPGDAERSADLLAPLAPNAGHLVHMPSHIYLRVGDMRKAVRVNKAAIEADESYFAEEPDLYRPDGDRYRYGYYPHNIHFVIAAAALSGDNDDVTQYAEKLLRLAPDKANGMRADLYRAVYYLARMNFSSPADIRNFPEPDPLMQQPLANVAYDFAQLMANIWDKQPFERWASKFDKDLADYRKAAEQENPNATCDKKPRRDPKTCVAAILDHLRHARVEALNRNWPEAEGAARDAVEIQDDLSDESYDEPPLWPYPVRQTLASVLIRKALAEDPDRGREDLGKAKQQLLESLNMNKSPGDTPNQIPPGRFPGNGWAYYGLWEIANHDDSSRAEMLQAWKDLSDHWFGAPEFHTLDRM